jgi:hypothetical protein
LFSYVSGFLAKNLVNTSTYFSESSEPKRALVIAGGTQVKCRQKVALIIVEMIFVDPTRYDRARVRKEGTQQVGLLGRLDRSHELHHLLRAWAQTRRRTVLHVVLRDVDLTDLVFTDLTVISSLFSEFSRAVSVVLTTN